MDVAGSPTVRQVESRVGIGALTSPGVAFGVGDFNYPVPDRILAKYCDRVKIHAYQEEGVLHIEPRDTSITCEQLQSEFGFEPYNVYLDRHIQGLNKLRGGCAASPQQAAHGSRAQYSK